MGPEAIVLLVVVLLLVLLMAGLPISLCLGLSGAVGIVLLRGIGVAGSTIESTPMQATSEYGLVVIPMFVLMGTLAVQAGIADDVFSLVNSALRRLPGALGLAAIGACAGFATVTGSSAATAATVGRTGVAAMRRHGYAEGFAAGIVASAGTLGVLIPPSIILVLYGIITGESIALLLLAGVIPGIISAAALGAYVILRATITPEVVGRNRDRADGPAEPQVRQPRFAGVGGLVRLFAISLVVVGGMYFGIFTATEAGAVAAFAALLFLVTRRDREHSVWNRFRRALAEATTTTSMIFMIIVGAAIFSYFLVSAEVPSRIADWVVELPVAPTVTVALMLSLFIPLGMFLDALSMLVIAVPLMYPTISELGFDGIWFGVLVVKMIELGAITPPIGINVFVVAGSVDPPVSSHAVFRGVIPFMFVDLALVAFFFAFPAIVTWFPSQAAV